MDVEEPVNRFITKLPRERFEPALGPATVSGLAVEIDDRTGLATRVKGLRMGGRAFAVRARVLARLTGGGGLTAGDRLCQNAPRSKQRALSLRPHSGWHSHGWAFSV